MGGRLSAFSQEELDEYRELTYLSEHEICSVFKRFKQLAPEIITTKRDARLPKETILKIPDLACNPFRERICKVFSGSCARFMWGKRMGKREPGEDSRQLLQRS